MALQIDLKNYGSMLEDFLGGADFGIAPQREGHTFEKIKADLVKRGRLRA